MADRCLGGIGSFLSLLAALLGLLLLLAGVHALGA